MNGWFRSLYSSLLPRLGKNVERMSKRSLSDYWKEPFCNKLIRMSMSFDFIFPPHRRSILIARHTVLRTRLWIPVSQELWCPRLFLFATLSPFHSIRLNHVSFIWLSNSFLWNVGNVGASSKKYAIKYSGVKRVLWQWCQNPNFVNSLQVRKRGTGICLWACSVWNWREARRHFFGEGGERVPTRQNVGENENQTRKKTATTKQRRKWTGKNK